MDDADAEPVETELKTPLTPRFLWIWGIATLMWILLAGVVWPLAILEPKYRAYLLSKAGAAPGPTSPCLYFLPVQYNNGARPISDFTVNNLRKCVCLSL
jgi:hypothetical protein